MSKSLLCYRSFVNSLKSQPEFCQVIVKLYTRSRNSKRYLNIDQVEFQTPRQIGIEDHSIVNSNNLLDLIDSESGLIVDHQLQICGKVRELTVEICSRIRLIYQLSSSADCPITTKMDDKGENKDNDNHNVEDNNDKEDPKDVGDNKNGNDDLKHRKSKTSKRLKIPPTVRAETWLKHCGDVFNGSCYCCGSKINSINFHAAHIVSDKDGGQPTVDNLVPTCSGCNLFMQTMNLHEFMEKYYPQRRNQRNGSCWIC